MKYVGSYEAKTHLPKLLEEVAKGNRITITRHGVPIAMLVPADERKAGVSDVIADIKKLRGSLSLKGLTVRELIDEGRRF